MALKLKFQVYPLSALTKLLRYRLRHLGQSTKFLSSALIAPYEREMLRFLRH